MGIRRFLHLELGRLFDKRKVILLIVFYVISILVIQSGIGQYKDGIEETKRFLEYENARVKSFQFYLQYGTYGFRLLYCPGPLSALFNNAGIFSTNLNAFIDAGERLTIYESFKGKSAFVGYTSIFLNLTGWLFLFGSLLSLFLGADAIKDKEFLTFLVHLKGFRKDIFKFILLTRLFLLGCICLVLALTAWILYGLNGFIIDVGQLLIYFLVFFLTAAFFLLWGSIAGTLKNKAASMVAIFAVWILFAFFIPATVGTIVYNQAESLASSDKLDLEKFHLMMTIEKKAKEMAGKLEPKNTNTKIRQQLFEYFWSNEFQKIFDHEQAMINDMKRVITLHHNLSLIFPTSFFLSVNNEISGRGYQNLITFYEHIFRHKIGFIKYYSEKSFFSDETVVKPYLKEEEIVFSAPSLLPGNFGLGMVMAFLWLMALGLLFWVFFKRFRVGWVDGVRGTSETQEIELKPENFKKDRTTFIWTSAPIYMGQLLENLDRQRINMVLVPVPDGLPGDVRIKSLLHFFGLDVPEKLRPMANQAVYRLSLDYKALVLLEILKSLEADFFIFNNFCIGLSDDFADYFSATLAKIKKGRKLAYFSNSLTATSIVWDDAIKIPGVEHPFV